MSTQRGGAPMQSFAARVEALAGFGISAPDIAIVLGIEPDEVLSIYRTELESGAIKTNARVAESLFRKAIGEGRESVTAAIFWLKTRARWKETSSSENAGQPVNVQIQRFSAGL